MTQQEQNVFRESWEDAQAWMHAVQEKLKLNDNTQGPRAALEARLRETEVRKMSLMLMRSDVLIAILFLSALLRRVSARWTQAPGLFTYLVMLVFL